MCNVVALPLAFLLSLFIAYVGLDRDRVLFPTVLAVVASYYSLFAMAGSAVQTLIIESSVLCVFLVATVLDLNRSLLPVAAALIARGLFDFVHERVASNPWVSLWWSSFGTSYDLTAITCLVVILWRRSGSKEAINLIRCSRFKLAAPETTAIK